MKITWTPESIETFEQIIEILNIYLTQKEIKKFIDKTDKTINLIQNNPFLYKASVKNKQVRKGFINKLVSMFYIVDAKKNEIQILSFWNNRQDPQKLKL